MGLRNIQFAYGFSAIDCARCSMLFGVTADFEARRRADHTEFYCPAGHAQSFPQETDLDKERCKSQMLADQVRMERGSRLKAERKLKRVARGTCPECKRHFANVERHMKLQHSE